MNFNRRVDHSRRGSDKSSIRSTKGYIILNNHNIDKKDINETGTTGMTKNTFISPSIESTQYIAAGADTTHCNVKSYTCVSDVQTNQKNTEDCLKRFQQEYYELLKRRKEEESTQCLSINDVTETRAFPTTYEKYIEPSVIDSNSFSLDELSACNLTVINSNNTLEKIEMNTMNSSIFSNSNYVEQVKDNYVCEKPQRKMKKRPYQCHKHNVNNINNQKHEKYREKINRRSYDDEKMCMHKNKENENIQKQKKDNAKFHGMLDGLNNEIIKIKKLFMSNQDNKSCCNHVNNITNRCNEMCAGEDLIDQDIPWESDELKTDAVKKSTKHEYNHQFKQQGNTNRLNHECRNYNNMKFGSTNEDIEYSEQSLEEHTADGFFIVKPSDRKIIQNENTDSNGKIAHYFLLQTPNICQCGMMLNKN